MALNPQLYGNGTPVPFVDEMFVLRRDAVDFEVDKIAEYVTTYISYTSCKPSSASLFFLIIVTLCIANSIYPLLY